MIENTENTDISCHFAFLIRVVICVTYYAYLACSIISRFYITSSTEVSARQCIRTNEAAANEKKLRQSSDRYPRHVLLNLLRPPAVRLCARRFAHSSTHFREGRAGVEQ